MKGKGGTKSISCYFRHLKDILAEAGIEVTPGNREQIDQIVHQLVGVTYKGCSEVWKRLKQQLAGGERRRLDFISRLRSSL